MDIIKKIGCYLPHNLQFYGGGSTWTMYSANLDGAVLLKNGWHDLVVSEGNIGDEYTPLLRRISDFGLPEQIACDREINEQPIHSPDQEITLWTRKIDWLLKNHYDIFGLIDANKAVDINTIL
jgi:hypothetical protein